MSDNPTASDVIGDIAAEIVSDFTSEIAEEAPIAIEPEMVKEVVEDTEVVEELQEGDEVEAESPEEDATEEEDSVGDGEYAEVAVLESDLQAEFSVLDEDGELEIPNIKVRYKANGRDREDRLDQVVKMAQMGVYNVERQEAVKKIEAHAQYVEQQVKETAATLQAREKQIERLLTDDNYLFEIRDRFEQHNSPEARARRAEEEVRSVRAQTEMAEISRKGTQFYTTSVEPALDYLDEVLPNVGKEELASRMVRQLQSHYVIGPTGEPYLPESSYGAVRDYLVEDLALWAQAQNLNRGGSATPVSGAQKALDEARVEAQKAKRVVGKKTRPVGKAKPGKVRSKPKPINNVDDAMDSALSEVLASVGL